VNPLALYLTLWALVVFLLSAKSIKEMHHIYIGLVLVLFFRGWVQWTGVGLCLDDAVLEHAALGLTGKNFSVVAWLYGKTLWKLPFVRELNDWLNRKLGGPTAPVA
jgi:hypothetical protein